MTMDEEPVENNLLRNIELFNFGPDDSALACSAVSYNLMSRLIDHPKASAAHEDLGGVDSLNSYLSEHIKVLTDGQKLLEKLSDHREKSQQSIILSEQETQLLSDSIYTTGIFGYSETLSYDFNKLGYEGEDGEQDALETLILRRNQYFHLYKSIQSQVTPSQDITFYDWDSPGLSDSPIV